MFSPLAFPTGSIIYDLTTFYPPPTHVALSPFELYREPLVIIALADAVELDHVSYRGNVRRSLNGNGPPKPEHNLRELYQDLEDLRDRYPKALVHQILLFDYVAGKICGPMLEGLVGVPPVEDCKRTTMKTIMCDISSMLLAEMTTLAKSLQALPTVESPNQAQISRHQNGTSWPTGHPDILSRRNSQFSIPSDSRSASPAGNTDRNHVRMSMPTLKRNESNASSRSGRPGTPTNGAATEQNTTFDEIVGPNPAESRRVPLPNRLADVVRDSSQDRVSVVGFGSNSLSERSRSKGKGRIGIVIGSLYMAAGRWNDALKELIEATTTAKNNLDHLWHAKGLDNIIVSMLMLAWTGLDFQIPQICYLAAEKGSSTPSAQEQKQASNRLVSLQNLTILLPELVDRILNLYARAANNTGESLPQYPFNESVLRFTKLLSAIHLAGGTLDDDVLRLLVLGTPSTRVPNLLTPRLNITPTRNEIVMVLFRAYPYTSSESISVVDRTIVLSGIASVLSAMGYHRKKAMVIRELVYVLIPGLIQARIKGAADMGVHPAAGLAALNAVNGNSNGAGALDLGEGDIEAGVDTFLGLLGQIYGVVSSSRFALEQNGSIDDSNDAVVSRILQSASVRSFGGQSMKMDVLRACINISEALPDFHGVLRFTSDLLRTAGSGIAPGPRSEDASPLMTREEQVRLATNISRTLIAARNLGVKNLEAEYWDEFLLRGVELEALPPSRTPIPHMRKELPGASAEAQSQLVNPFIYNPFLRTPDTAAVDRLLLAREGAVFRITLQNPYEFDVEIESIKLETEGIDFESGTQKTIIGPYRTQILTIAGTPKTAGQMKITGCLIRVRGCRERRFPIFVEPWSPQQQAKIKTIGVAALFKPKDRPVSVSSKPTVGTPIMVPPKPTLLGLNVIERQPVVVVKSTTLSQSAIMVLEGERQVFSVTLQNLSKDTPVDLLLFSFKDSTQAPLQAAMANRDASPAELYECELIYARKQALRWKKKDDESLYIEPGGTSTFDIEVLGRPGLTSATIQVDYAHLGVPQAEVAEKFHTRQVSLPLTITVNASVELTRLDVLPLNSSLPRSIWTNFNGIGEVSFAPEDHCLLLMDLRNAWPGPLHVQLKLNEGASVNEEILPGNTSRVIVPIRRLFLENPSAAIPALDPARQRQFVVSTGRVSAETERASRESFWYREEVLKMLHGTWNTKSSPDRSGEIELRGIRLNQRMIEAIRIDDIGIDLSVNDKPKCEQSHELFTDRMSELKVRITNRTSEPLYPLLRVQPSIQNQPHNVSLDLAKKLTWNGTLQQALPQLAGKEIIEIILGVTALSRGQYEISASVEEARLIDPPKQENTDGGRPRSNTKAMMDAVLGARERRIWHSRQPCVLVARDEESDDDDDDNDE